MEVRWKPGAAATVVCAAKGYPGSYPKGFLVFHQQIRCARHVVRPWSHGIQASVDNDH